MRTHAILCLIILFAAGCGTYPDPEAEKKPSVTFSTNLENPDSLLSATPLSWKNEGTIKEGHAFSGKYAVQLDHEHEFSLVFEQKLGYVSALQPERLTYEAMVYSDKPAPEGSMVVSIDDKGYYQSFSISDFFASGGEWKKVSATFQLPDTLDPSDLIKVYIWNNKSGELLIDDISIKFELKPEKKE